MKYTVLFLVFALSMSLRAMAQSPATAADDEVNQYEVKVDKQACYPGGAQAVKDYILRHLFGLKEVMGAKAQGRVFVKFTVGTNGRVNRVEVMKSGGELLSAAATPIFNQMKDWKPASLHEQPVEVPYVFPVTFKSEQ